MALLKVSGRHQDFAQGGTARSCSWNQAETIQQFLHKYNKLALTNLTDCEPACGWNRKMCGVRITSSLSLPTGVIRQYKLTLMYMHKLQWGTCPSAPWIADDATAESCMVTATSGLRRKHATAQRRHGVSLKHDRTGGQKNDLSGTGRLSLSSFLGR